MKTALHHPNKMRSRVLVTLICAAVIAAGWFSYRLFNKDSTLPVRIDASSPFANVVLLPNTQSALVDVQLFYPFGEMANDGPEGLAHYLEHLAWKSSSVQSVGAERHTNAWTSMNATAYWRQTHPEMLADAVAQVAATAGPLNVDEDFALQERDIVLREYERGQLDRKLAPIWREMGHMLYQGTPRSREVIGTPQSIASFTLEQARALHAKTHILSAATLTIEGNVSKADVVRVLNGLDLTLIPAPAAAEIERPPNLAKADIQETNLDGIGGPVLLYRKTVTRPKAITFAKWTAFSELAADLWLSTKAGSLVRPLHFDTATAQGVTLYLTKLTDDLSELQIEVRPEKDVTLDVLLAELEALLENSAASVPEDSFADIKDRSLADYNGVLDVHAWNRSAFLKATGRLLPFLSFQQRRAAVQDLTYSEFLELLTTLTRGSAPVVRLVNSS